MLAKTSSTNCARQEVWAQLCLGTVLDKILDIHHGNLFGLGWSLIELNKVTAGPCSDLTGREMEFYHILPFKHSARGRWQTATECLRWSEDDGSVAAQLSNRPEITFWVCTQNHRAAETTSTPSTQKGTMKANTPAYSIRGNHSKALRVWVHTFCLHTAVLAAFEVSCETLW